MSDEHPYAKGTLRRAQHDSDTRDIVIDALAKRHAAFCATLDALEQDMRESARDNPWNHYYLKKLTAILTEYRKFSS
jgi:hypothetical protein